MLHIYFSGLQIECNVMNQLSSPHPTNIPPPNLAHDTRHISPPPTIQSQSHSTPGNTSMPLSTPPPSLSSNSPDNQQQQQAWNLVPQANISPVNKHHHSQIRSSSLLESSMKESSPHHQQQQPSSGNIYNKTFSMLDTNKDDPSLSGGVTRNRGGSHVSSGNHMWPNTGTTTNSSGWSGAVHTNFTNISYSLSPGSCYNIYPVSPCIPLLTMCFICL